MDRLLRLGGEIPANFVQIHCESCEILANYCYSGLYADDTITLYVKFHNFREDECAEF